MASISVLVRHNQASTVKISEVPIGGRFNYPCGRIIYTKISETISKDYFNRFEHDPDRLVRYPTEITFEDLASNHRNDHQEGFKEEAKYLKKLGRALPKKGKVDHLNNPREYFGQGSTK